MKSRAHFKGHPLHPMLIPFPIAFLTGCLVFDILAVWNGNANFHHTAYYLQIAGIATALVAAVPGIIDYFATVPPDSSAKKRASLHGGLNLLLVAVFTLAWFYRRQEEANITIVIIMEAAGFILMLFTGWMGATLVYRNQIGVNPRYADAGKWKEVFLGSVEGNVEVGQASDLKVNQMMLVHVNNKRVVVGRAENGVVAFSDYCTHRGGSLAGGAMICGTVQCPWHGSQFDVSSGEVKAGPAKKKIDIYEASERGGKIFLNAPADKE